MLSSQGLKLDTTKTTFTTETTDDVPRNGLSFLPRGVSYRYFQSLNASEKDLAVMGH